MVDATLTPTATDLVDILTATRNRLGNDWLSSIFGSSDVSVTLTFPRSRPKK